LFTRAARAIVLCIVHPLTMFFYRVQVADKENLPPKSDGPILFVANHVSYADALVVTAGLDRPVRFLMARPIYDKPVINWICRIFRTIPIHPTGTFGEIRNSLDAVVDALKQGDSVCMFPEGFMTRTGHVQQFKRGIEIMARKAGVPIVPLYIDGLWGSTFSYEGGHLLKRWPSRLRRRVRIVCGKPLPSTTEASEARRAVMELGPRAYALRKEWQRPLHFRFWRMARRMGRRLCMVDSTGARFSFRRTLIASLIVRRWMSKHCGREEMVGMMMPPSCGAALINIAAVMAGKIPINLNFTSSPEAIQKAIDRCSLQTIFTSKKFIHRLNMTPLDQFVYIEDIIASVSGLTRIICLIQATLLPTWFAERWLMRHKGMDDLATIMFTSGSTGSPKGVMLSHHNVVSNIEAMAEVLQFGPDDTVMGVLPPFHSFGFTVTLWLPVTCGVPVAYHPNPLDADGVGKMAEEHSATILLGTPTFYALYTRGCKPAQFASLRIAIVGGQKLMPSIATAFESRFGLPLSEGYGATELAPVVSVNSEDIVIAEVHHPTHRDGSVGRPLPGLAVRIVKEEASSSEADNGQGTVFISGPNTMMGYMDDEAATAEVLRDGWYRTGDVGSLDDDGFLHIHDRLSRFSKIAGEMVSHTAVENALHETVGTNEQPEDEGYRHFAIMSTPDAVRGERLIVLYDGPGLDAKETVANMQASDIPNLWIPAARDFARVERVPLLASGKLDMREARQLAAKHIGADESAE
jgi:acyl-[acyl-carrier-protein]-phospholipid O-acyltransferase / long-chain-fatty-acid--[acyl-carrier-protein] ligase